MPTETIMYIILGLCLFYVVVGVFKELISTMVGTVYPIFKSLEAIEKNDPDEMKLWLAYWVIFSLFCIADRIADKMCLKKVIPFYFLMKLSFLIFLFHPRTLGAKVLVEKVVQPFIDGHEADVYAFTDQVMTQIDGLVQEKLGDIQDKAVKETLKKMVDQL